MPDKLLNLSDKILDIVHGDTSKQLPLKYLSEIITARVEEILMAVFYEIENSGFADSLRSGIVVTGGCAQTANLCNLIYDLSGYKARVGYPHRRFSCEGCDNIGGTSAATAVGLIMACIGETDFNCTMTGENILKVEPLSEDIGIVGTEEDPQGRIFKDGQIEEVGKPAKKKNERPKRLFGFKIRIGDIFEQAYNIVNENQPESTNDQEEIIDDEEEKA
jgi:cell division protein FtsA